MATELTFLGVEGYPWGERETIALLMEHDGYRILLDCGASIVHQLGREGLNVSDVDAVFVSHVHADHSSGLPLMLFGNVMDRFQGRTSGPGTLEVLGDEATLTPVLAYCKAAYPALFAPDNPVRVKQTLLAVGDSKDIAPGVSVTCAGVSHAVPGLASRWTVGDMTLCYTADTRASAGIVALAEGADILVCNVLGTDDQAADTFGFLSAAGAGRLATEAGVAAMALIHLPDEVARAEAIAAASAEFRGHIFAPANGEHMTASS